jgi:signal transduction histidine kinase
MNQTESAQPTSDLERLQAKVRKLADEKSYLQLVIRLIEQINPLPGIEDMVSGMLRSIIETIGGTNIRLYYWIEQELHYADFAGERKVLAGIDDPLVARVGERREFLEQQTEKMDSLMHGSMGSGAWTWIFPLTVGDTLVGIIKLENLHVPSASLRNYLPIFFSHAALILSNEIRNFTRQREEAELARYRDHLEQLVAERTAELQTANTDLRAEKTRQEELIRKLAEAHSQLLQSEKLASIGQLAAGVAHEINNPIGFVNSNLGTLKRYITDLLRAMTAYENSEGEMTEGTRAVLADLKRQIDIVYLREDVGNLLTESMDGLLRVKRIIQDLKDFSHVDESEKQWADLEHGLDSTLNVVWNELKYKAEVIKEYGGIPKIMCIPSQLNQVFMNLLMNAVQSIEGHGRITIRTGQEGDNVWVEVEDTGKGIKPEHLDRIFDPFFTTKPVGTGTGLGLSLSYGIVQKHGGHIEVNSNLGKGTTMRMWLPAKIDDASLPERASIVTG